MLSEYPEPQGNHQWNPIDWSQVSSSKTLDPSYKNSSFQKAPCLLLSSLWIIHKFFEAKKQIPPADSIQNIFPKIFVFI